jgi:GETHR pentapeptide repeat (5 copies)
MSWSQRVFSVMGSSRPPEAVRPETVRPETVRPETVRPEAVRSETVRGYTLNSTNHSTRHPIRHSTASLVSDLANCSTTHRAKPADWIPNKQPELGFSIEYVGLQGEYDPQGLAKRVARAFDQHPQVRQIRTLCIIQHEAQITLLGKVSSAALLQQVIELAQQVEGTRKVDVDQVVVEGVSLSQP